MNEWTQTNVRASGCGGEKKNPTDNNWEQNHKRRREHWLLIFFAQYISVVGGVLTPYETPLHTKSVCAFLLCRTLPSSFDFVEIRIRMFVGHTVLFTVCVPYDEFWLLFLLLLLLLSQSTFEWDGTRSKIAMLMWVAPPVLSCTHNYYQLDKNIHTMRRTLVDYHNLSVR